MISFVFLKQDLYWTLWFIWSDIAPGLATISLVHFTAGQPAHCPAKVRRGQHFSLLAVLGKCLIVTKWSCDIRQTDGVVCESVSLPTTFSHSRYAGEL